MDDRGRFRQNQLMLGMDAARQGYWSAYGGGPGWTFLLGEFADSMRDQGVSDDAMHAIFVANPARAFAFASNRVVS
jgi:phosphotriesterase-related protein